MENGAAGRDSTHPLEYCTDVTHGHDEPTPVHDGKPPAARKGA